MRHFEFRVWDLLDRKMREWGNIFSLPAWEIFPGTPEQRCYQVMQYTGIKDKTQKEICEGDIVYMRCDGLSGFGKVIFEKGCFWIEDKKRKRTYPLYNEAEYRIDGNIFENPELLQDE